MMLIISLGLGCMALSGCLRKDSDIGTIDEEWNWLDGHSDPELKAKNVHFTTGGPWFKDWKCKRSIDGQYASEWNGDYTYLAGHGKIQPYEL